MPRGGCFEASLNTFEVKRTEYAGNPVSEKTSSVGGNSFLFWGDSDASLHMLRKLRSRVLKALPAPY
jgi:hypothetical protein